MTAPLRKLGRYELLRRLAIGGMGEIYLARARGAGGFEKTVIIKTILPHLAEEEEFVTKFLDEGRIVVQLTHGNIVPVFDMGEDDGEYFIAMEYVPGLDLRAILKRLQTRGEVLPVEIALYIACEICKGLGYAHRKTGEDGQPLGIVHRDVSPSNVLISREGEVKIIDFGIARAAGKLSQTASGAIQGKCCYMSPEQARGKVLDSRSDTFSTAVLLYEMLTGTRPFEGRSDLESLELVRCCNADPPGILRPEISQQLDEILQKAMSAEPDDRYQGIDDFYVELQHEIYRLGHTVTSQRLVDALGDVFDDDAAEEPFGGKPANLDQALELQLAQLDAEPSPSSPISHSDLGLAKTATSTPRGTRTIAPTPTTFPDPSTSPPESTHSDNLTPEENPPSTRLSRPFLSLALTFIIASILTAAAFALRPTPTGLLSLQTDPPGAQIHLDGEELVGKRTPETLTLDPGNYRIDLTFDGHQPRRFRVDIAAGETIALGPQDLRLLPEPRPPRTFTIDVDAPSASILADGEPLGPAPQTITLNQGDIINLAAHAPDCTPAFYSLSYGHQRDEISLAPLCERDDQTGPDPAQTNSPSNESSPQLGSTAHRRILIESIPPGATILINDDPLGRAPLYAQLRPQQPAVIEARHDGFQPHSTVIRPSDLIDDRLEISLQQQPTGCLTLRPVYPANNEIAINGDWLEGRHMALRNHTLPAGRNSITVRHPESGKEETFPVTIDPGDDCKFLVVWERDEP